MKLRLAPRRRGVLTVLEEPAVSPVTGAELRILEATRDRLTIERVFKPGMGTRLEHVHVDYDEKWVVKEGMADAELDGDPQRLSGSDPERRTLHVPAGMPHVNPHNCDIRALVVEQSFLPPSDGARSYVKTLEQVLREGRDDDGELPWPLVLAVGDATDERTYVARVPYWLQRPALAVGRAVAGLQGHEVYLPRPPAEGEGPYDEGWLPIGVVLLDGGDVQGTVIVGPGHTFGELALAIDAAFNRWHVPGRHAFAKGGWLLGQGDGERAIEQEQQTDLQVVDELQPGDKFEFISGDGTWHHVCFVGEPIDPKRMGPGRVPRAPVAVGPWGAVPDPYGPG